jgi:hypothetical protein
MVVNKRQVAQQQFGFRFQVYAGLYLALKHIGDLVSVEFEANLEDVQIRLKNNKTIYAQVKTHYHESPDAAQLRSAQTTLKAALEGLYLTFYTVKSQKNDAIELHYIFNFSNPFGSGRTDAEKKSLAYLVGELNDSPLLNYKALTTEQKAKIDGVINQLKNEHGKISRKDAADFRNQLKFKRYLFTRFQDDHDQMIELIRRIEKFQQKNGLDLRNTDGVVALILSASEENMAKQNVEISKEQFLTYFLIADSMARSSSRILGRKKSADKVKDRDEFYNDFLRWTSENAMFRQNLNSEFSNWAQSKNIEFTDFESYDEDEDEIIEFLKDRASNLLTRVKNVIPGWSEKVRKIRGRSLTEEQFVQAAMERYIESVVTITYLMEGDLKGVD